MRTLKKWLYPLRNTVLHPQWLIYREGKLVAEQLHLIFRGRLLDIGCGDKWVATRLNDSCDYIGLDYPETVAFGYEGKPNVLGDAHCLPFASECMDGVVMLDVLEHLRSPEKALVEAHRVLKENGKLLIQVPFIYPVHDAPNDFHRWTRHGLEQLLNHCGFRCKALDYYGSPIQTAAGLLSIALANAVLSAYAKKNAALLLVPILILAIPVINSLGWLAARLSPPSDIMPLSYRVFAIKEAA